MKPNSFIGPAILIQVAIFFERLAFYGMRSVLMLYVVYRLQWTDTKAVSVYGLFLTSLYLAKIPGGLIADLLGRKWICLAGSFLQMIGILLLTTNLQAILWPALICIIAGNALFTPAIYARMGTTWQLRPGKEDAGFTLNYIFINVGAFLGSFIVANITYSGHYTVGFIVSGLSMFIAAMAIIFLPNRDPEPTKVEAPVNQLSLIGIFPIFLVFWLFFELGSGAATASIAQADLTGYLNMILQVAFTVGFTIVFALCWFFIQVRSNIKIGVGFLLCGLAFLVMLVLQLAGSDYVGWMTLTVLLGAGESLASPIMHSLLVKIAPRRWLATCFGFMLGIIYLSYSFSEYIVWIPNSVKLVICGGGMIATGIPLFFMYNQAVRNSDILDDELG